MTDSSPRKLIIAIDGPAGAGKSTIASRLARKLGYVNLESGAMYRALALRAIECDASFDDENALLKMAQDSRITLDRSSLGHVGVGTTGLGHSALGHSVFGQGVLAQTGGGNRVLLNGKDVSARIRERDVTEAASRVSVHPKVRAWMVERQREMGIGGVVMEGRDIGTKVFPDADLKIFLDADPVIREQRRLDQQQVKGAPAQAMAAELRERDLRDRTRAVSPLVAAEDAIVIDSTNLSEDDVVNRIEKLVEQRLAGKR
jgi:cytidylate kinase